jgi:ankyrin repeat protein
LEAAKAGQQEFLKALLDRGVPVNMQDNNKMTALFYAVSKKYVEMAICLLEHGADLKIQTGTGPLGDLVFLEAVRHGLTELVELLLSKGIDINMQDASGQTPLMYALYHRPPLVPFLLAKGADVTIADKRGRTALDFPCSPENAQLIRNAAASAKPMRAKPIREANAEPIRRDESVHAFPASALCRRLRSHPNRGPSALIRR